MKRLIPLLVVIILGIAGCGSSELQPLAFNPAPWQDGEVTTYDVFDKAGQLIGQASWTWRAAADGWVQSYELNLSGRRDRGEVVLDQDLLPASAWREVGDTRYEATYTADAVTIKTIAGDGMVTTKDLARPADGLDNDQTLQVQRALPLAEDYATRYTDVILTTGLAVPVRLSVIGTEEVTVPAGAYTAWRVVMDFGSGKHDGWYAQDAPYPLLKYRNRASGAEFHLRSWQPGAGQPIIGSQPTVQPEATAEAEPSGPPPLNIPFLVAALAAQYPLMLIFPVLLGWWIRRRYGVGWGIFGAGALTFIASQVVHLPLNWALGLLGGGRGVALWPIIPMALVAGFSAGICEEVARWIALRFFLKRVRGWREALQFGAGHGGAEAIIFGLLALVSLVSMIALRSLDPAVLGITGAQADQVQTALSQYWSTPWYMAVLGGLERVIALSFHVAMAVLVMRAVMRRRVGYLLAAIGAHAAMDFMAVWAGQTVGPIWTEVVALVFGLAALWLVIRLREAPSPAGPALATDPETEPRTPATEELARQALSPEELARRADVSRYE